MLTETF